MARLVVFGLFLLVASAQARWLFASTADETTTATAASNSTGQSTVTPVNTAATSSTATSQADSTTSQQPAGTSDASSTTSSIVPTVVPTSGVYFFSPSPSPLPVVAGAAAPNATGNITLPDKPAPGKNRLVVFTVDGTDANAILKNQALLRKTVADTAQVDVASVYFYNSSVDTDPRTGVKTVALTVNVACNSEGECDGAGERLWNQTNQAAIQDKLASSGVTVLPYTFQVYGTNIPDSRKGNATLATTQVIAAETPSPSPVLLPSALGLGLPLGAGGNFSLGLGALDSNLTTGITGLANRTSVLVPGGTTVTADNATSMLPSPSPEVMVEASPSPQPAKSGTSAAAASVFAALAAAAAMLLL